MNPPSQIRSLFPALSTPSKRHKAVGFTEKQFHYAFTNTLDEATRCHELIRCSTS